MGGSPSEPGRGARTPTTPQAPWEPDLTLRRLLLHVGAGQVAVHEGRLAAGQVPHDALKQRRASPTTHAPGMAPSTHEATPTRRDHR